jgi:HEPN domain-containing protein
MKNDEILSQWLKLADDDLDTAQFLLRRRKKILWVVCFHAQQSAEKYLKAFLILRGIKFDPIHDLIRLVSQCAQLDAEFNLVTSLCEFLQPFSVKVRYPGEISLELSEARKAVQAAQEIRNLVIRKVEASG